MKLFITTIALFVFATSAFSADAKTPTTKAPVQKSISGAKQKPVKVAKVKTHKPVHKPVSSATKKK